MTFYDEPQTHLDRVNGFDKHIELPHAASLGSAQTRYDIRSTIGPFQYLSEWKAEYPEAVTGGLVGLFDEYNRAFEGLVAENTEWDSDYRYCRVGPGGSPVNFFVQVDMVGLPPGYLQAATGANSAHMRADLTRRVFEIENSLAMYQLLERICSRDGENSPFREQFRAALNDLRRLHGMPIALLAVTDQKHQAMRESEFGKTDDEPLTQAEVAGLSGFDAFFGPDEFADHLRRNNGRSGYMLYVRASDPVSKLRDPRKKVEVPLLADPSYRRVIKEAAITLNIDNPDWLPGDPRRINDTKGYLPTMGMGHVVRGDEDLLTPGLLAHLQARGSAGEYQDGALFTPEFAAYLRTHGVDEQSIARGALTLRAKPSQGSYGCYGHLRGAAVDGRFRSELRRGIRDRGPYVIQPEMPTPVVLNETDGREYLFIDRNWLATDGTTSRFIGGYRSFMPTDSPEASMGRNHGSGYTVWGEIVA